MGGKGGKGWRGKRKRAGGKGQGAAADAAADDAADGDGEPAPKRAAPARNDIWQEESGNWELSNELYESYYQRQGVCPPSEWPKLLEALRTGLPVAIRVNRMRVGASSLCTRLSEMQAACSADPSRELYAPQSLTWYPHHLAWQWLGLERRTVKKDKKNARLKDYLMQRERSGLISRQEVVSMIPPLFLDVQPHHLVLDLCAAPGSKTSQMIEVMHWESAKGSGRPTGLVLANELQWKRANMLAHQVQRMGSPCTAVINMDAQFFPDLWISPQAGDAAAERRPLRFDRVLCDVPCSGDGTMRKTPYIWRSWTPRDGASLHIRQLGILNRGLELLKVGGRLVYSTCSLNPLEDEAVVAAALQRQGDALALLPPPKLEGFRAATCLERWVVKDPNADVYYEDYDSVPKASKEGKCKVLPSMFPPKGTDDASAAIRQAVRDHCVRLLPHLMDTGGFFVAIFEKRSELRASAKAKREDFQQARREQQVSAAAVTTAVQEAQPAEVSQAAQPTPAAQAVVTPSPPQAPQGLKKLSNEYVPVDTHGTQWKDISEFYGLDASLAKLFVRRREKDERVFLLSEGLEQLLRSEVKTPTRMVLCGVTVFQRAASYHVRACPWRPLQQGLATLVALGLKRRLSASRAFVVRLLREKELSFSEVREAAAAGELHGLEAVGLAESATVEDLRPGSLAVVLDEEKDGRGLPPFAVAAVLSDDMLESAAGSAQDVAALLEDLEGQPGVEDILRPPAAAGDDSGAYDADAEVDAADGAEDAEAEPDVEGDESSGRNVAETIVPE